ncbi:MFS transporter [Paracoccus denitrificans]|uniref:Major facilitator superfamily MFS_1 n=1 Tax=Paracoccus denitrificans (strain Pd 1222) TaxID=318586 RepID=A1BBK1_PARDP|nr:MFS transporter [Paracoccus denitrificans]ABL72895.1 major facilitator superfamily MFS_1 [Paracoccus denitrificans PD1222]MBB4626374.1 FSR family fosmidomycin resistance protein-like MFS transporter [Paracoccus denitrificans]MCU7427421.1 MFS transporter [Paracoccus denitrificans]QAR29303.1 MFS transporter [Paracoccus denitrificans]UPV98368.1 MFS transporter [Paracoccus denitrificans]
MSTSPHAFAGKLKNPTVFPVLWAASFCHLLNDMMQALLPAVYPILQGDFELSFMQVGLLTFVYQLTASILQPFIGHYTDRRPMPYSLPFGMAASMAGLLTLAFAPNYGMLLAGGMMLGIGSSIFHPESSRIARLASGGSHGLAQSLFQVGGNFGSALGPLAAALIVLPLGQAGLAWFALVALLGITVLTGLGNWYRRNGHARPSGRKVPERHAWLSRPQVSRAMAILIALLFSKYIYLASFTSYYTFYLMDRFGVSIATAQILQFVFFASVAAGTIAGGPIGDRLGRKPVIWVSILGVLPFTLLLPHAGLAATVILSVVIGLLMSSAFPAIVVYGQELMPGRVGMVSGLFFGFIFGIGGIGAALLGVLADLKGISFVFLVCSCLPVFGILTAWLPDLREPGGR